MRLLIPAILVACTPALPEHRVFADAASAFAEVLASDPRVIGVGEVHASSALPMAGPTTLARFTRELLPVLAPRATDLVLETWRLDPMCAPMAAVVSETIQQETHRPEQTSDELTLLVQAALAAGIRPHDLVLSCQEHASLLGADGAVDYGLLLRLLTGKLQQLALGGLKVPDATVVLYGGAVHNDLSPAAEAAAYSYGPVLREKAGETYVEVDLLDPAILRGKPSLIEPGWAKLMDLTGPDRVVLHRRGPGSWVLLLPAP